MRPVHVAGEFYTRRSRASPSQVAAGGDSQDGINCAFGARCSAKLLAHLHGSRVVGRLKPEASLESCESPSHIERTAARNRSTLSVSTG